MFRDYTLNYAIVRIVMEKLLLPKIIYEDEFILALNKPSGLVVHPFDYSDEYTLIDFLHEKIPTSFSIENRVTLQDKRIIELGGIIHKLDRDTSGVLVVAKTQKIFDELKIQFRNHTVKKIYMALVEGKIALQSSSAFKSEFGNSSTDSDTFTIDAPLGRDKKGYKQSTNPKNPRGELRSAVTGVEVLKRNTTTTLVKLYPKTGRTHQLRAHMSSIGHPILGDKAYGSTTDSPRIMLHAESLIFTIGEREQIFKVEAPKEFVQ